MLTRKCPAGELHELRKLANMTCERIARAVGATVGEVAKWEAGEPLPLAVWRLALVTIVPNYGDDRTRKAWHKAEQDGFLTFNQKQLPYLIQTAWHARCDSLGLPYVQYSGKLIFYDFSQLRSTLRPREGERLVADMTAVLNEYDDVAKEFHELWGLAPPFRGCADAANERAGRDLAKALVRIGTPPRFENAA